jgi:hypothetical protein
MCERETEPVRIRSTSSARRARWRNCVISSVKARRPAHQQQAPAAGSPNSIFRASRIIGKRGSGRRPRYADPAGARQPQCQDHAEAGEEEAPVREDGDAEAMRSRQFRPG